MQLFDEGRDPRKGNEIIGGVAFLKSLDVRLEGIGQPGGSIFCREAVTDKNIFYDLWIGPAREVHTVRSKVYFTGHLPKGALHGSAAGAL